jgi:hypothetical protein
MPSQIVFAFTMGREYLFYKPRLPFCQALSSSETFSHVDLSVPCEENGNMIRKGIEAEFSHKVSLDWPKTTTR